LRAARTRANRIVVVTNAHRDTLAIKVEETRLDALVDEFVCAHDFDAPKESAEFWVRLASRQPFDPTRAVLIEDNVAVLAAARAFGFGNSIAIRRPDSRAAPRTIDDFVAVDGVADLL